MFMMDDLSVEIHRLSCSLKALSNHYPVRSWRDFRKINIIFLYDAQEVID